MVRLLRSLFHLTRNVKHVRAGDENDAETNGGVSSPMFRVREPPAVGRPYLGRVETSSRWWTHRCCRYAVDFKRQNERESKDMYMYISRLFALLFLFSEANFPENADLVFFIFKNKRAKEDAERENKRESSSSSARGIDF